MACSQPKRDLIINKAGYSIQSKIADSLQGSIYRSTQKSTNKKVVIKSANIRLHSQSMAKIDAKHYRVNENILKEIQILKHLTEDKNCPNFIVKYIESFKGLMNYYLVMEDGGFSLFNFIVKVHRLIRMGKLEITEWHRVVKIILKQMIVAIEYLHGKGVSHFDISLENWILNDLDVVLVRDGDKETIKFLVSETMGVEIKLIDFGLAEIFPLSDDKYKDGLIWKSNKYCGKQQYKSPEVTQKKVSFDAKSNDIFCLGVCVFIMIIGNPPWNATKDTDSSFCHIWNGELLYVLSAWNKLSFVNKEIFELFDSFFKCEDERITIEQLKKSKWLN